MRNKILVVLAMIVLAILAFTLVVNTDTNTTQEKNYCEFDPNKTQYENDSNETQFERYVGGSSIQEIQHSQKQSEFSYKKQSEMSYQGDKNGSATK